MYWHWFGRSTNGVWESSTYSLGKVFCSGYQHTGICLRKAGVWLALFLSDLGQIIWTFETQISNMQNCKIKATYQRLAVGLNTECADTGTQW